MTTPTPLKADRTAEREAFEAHIRQAWRVPFDYLEWALKLNDRGAYCDSRAEDQWSGWLARATPTARSPDRHIYQGGCPDETNGWKGRDPACPACSPPPAAAQADAVLPSDGDYARWAEQCGAKVDWNHERPATEPRVSFATGAQWGRFCDKVRAAISTKGAGEGKAEDPLSRTCPVCTAPAGFHCVRTNGVKAAWTHLGRLTQPAAAEAPARKPLPDSELAELAYKGFDDYWTEDCKGRDSEAWTASAKAVLAAHGIKEAK